MPRPIASLNVSFGLVSIPVNLYTAAESSGYLGFHLLHKDCGSRLKQQYICPEHDTVVERSEMVKGFEFEKGRYVEFSPEEIKSLQAVGSRTIDVAEFIPLESIDPVWFEKTYYLSPGKGGAKPYQLFVDALDRSKRCAVGSWASHGKQHIVALRAAQDRMVMQQLYFQDEIRPVTQVEAPKIEIKEAERKLALQLIEQQAATDFDPSRYKDEVRERIQAAIQQKVEGKKITIAEEPSKGAEVIDLMEALRASLREPKGARQGPMRKPPKRAARARRMKSARRAKA